MVGIGDPEVLRHTADVDRVPPKAICWVMNLIDQNFLVLVFGGIGEEGLFGWQVGERTEADGDVLEKVLRLLHLQGDVAFVGENEGIALQIWGNEREREKAD